MSGLKLKRLLSSAADARGGNGGIVVQVGSFMKTRLLLLLLFLCMPLSAQEKSSLEPAARDSILAHSSVDTVSVLRTTPGTPPTFVMTKSPWLAVGLSALLPGAGQFYNESYWKIPIVLGLGTYFVSQWIHNNNLAEDYRQQFDESITPENPFGDPTLLAIREFYKDERDTFVWYTVILYVVQLADAYVDANLYDFNVGDDLSVRFLPDAHVVAERSFRFGVQVTFH